MLILKNSTQAETWAKNSRFLGEAFSVSSVEEAKAKWQYRKQNYDNGGHIVYAFAVGPQQNILGCSDDGEPSGTAGRPVLAVLKGSGITNIMITVARWFGGTKLGTGGLVHAYSDAAKAVLEKACTRELVSECSYRIKVPYNLYNTLMSRLLPLEFAVTEEIFSANIELSGTIKEVRSQLLETVLAETGNGRIIWSKHDPQ